MSLLQSNRKTGLLLSSVSADTDCAHAHDQSGSLHALATDRGVLELGVYRTLEKAFEKHTLLIQPAIQMSNIPFIALGIFGILQARALVGVPLRARLRAALTHSFLTVIGLGSFVFHTTLSWHAQVILDELPMLWSASMGLYLTTVGGAERGSTRLKLLMVAIPAGLSWL